MFFVFSFPFFLKTKPTDIFFHPSTLGISQELSISWKSQTSGAAPPEDFIADFLHRSEW
jgi:hypothetical protein